MAVAGTQRDTEFILRISILDFPMNPDQLTRLLGVVPTIAHTKGAFRIPGHTFERNAWRKDAVSRGSPVVSKHILGFLEAFAPLRERLTGLDGMCEVALRCHINDYGKGYVIYCDSGVIHRLAEIRASLEVIVHLGENEAEAPNKDSIDLGFVADEEG